MFIIENRIAEVQIDKTCDVANESAPQWAEFFSFDFSFGEVVNYGEDCIGISVQTIIYYGVLDGERISSNAPPTPRVWYAVKKPARCGPCSATQAGERPAKEGYHEH